MGLNEPQALGLPQVTDHATPALFESLSTAAAITWVAPLPSDDGAAEVRETEIGVGVVEVLEPPPHAIKVASRLTVTRRRNDLRDVIEHLH